MTALVLILRIVWSAVAVGIVVTVLLHAAKGDGIAAIGGSAQLFSSQKSAEQNLDRVTWSLVAAFLLLSIVLSAGWLGGRTGVPAGTLPPAGRSAPLR